MAPFETIQQEDDRWSTVTTYINHCAQRRNNHATADNQKKITKEETKIQDPSKKEMKKENKAAQGQIKMFFFILPCILLSLLHCLGETAPPASLPQNCELTFQMAHVSTYRATSTLIQFELASDLVTWNLADCQCQPGTYEVNLVVFGTWDDRHYSNYEAKSGKLLHGINGQFEEAHFRIAGKHTHIVGKTPIEILGHHRAPRQIYSIRKYGLGTIHDFHLLSVYLKRVDSEE